MDYDEAGVEMQFKSAAAISVTYTLLERCGYEPTGWFDKDDFQAIYNFSTPDTVYTLGAAVSDISREVLRTVERAVKTTIRRRNNERSQHEYEQQSELHADRGLSSPEPDPASAKDPAGQVRQDAPELLKQQHPVLYHTMLLNGSLYPTLTELEQTAAAMKEQMIVDLLAKNPAPDKEKNQIAWVQHMNSLREQVEEVIRTELIYS